MDESIFLAHGTYEGRVMFGEVILVAVPAPKPADEDDPDA